MGVYPLNESVAIGRSRDKLRALQLLARDGVGLPVTAFANSTGSTDDPFCGLERARSFAMAWGADFIDAGPRGHLNAESGLGDWSQGHQAFLRLSAGTTTYKEN